jgi:hypothetical protein
VFFTLWQQNAILGKKKLESIHYKILRLISKLDRVCSEEVHKST